MPPQPSLPDAEQISGASVLGDVMNLQSQSCYISFLGGDEVFRVRNSGQDLGNHDTTGQ